MSKQLRIWLFVLLGTLLASTSLLAEGVITMTTTKLVGETISLRIEANGDVTIDGVKESARTDGGSRDYTLTSQTVTIRGDVTELDCYWNQLTSLDVSSCTALTTLSCSKNQLTSLDVSGCTALTTLYCGDQLTSLNVSGCTALTKLNCSDNQLTSLDVSKNTALTELYCSNNQLTSLDVSQNTALTTLFCYGNQLTSLDVSGCSALTKLWCYENQLTSLNVSGCTSLTTLECYDNQLTSLNVSGCTSLTELYCSNNQLTSLNVSGCTSLTTLGCGTNPLIRINLSNCKSLEKFTYSFGKLTSLDVSGCSALTTLYCYGNQLTRLNLSGCSALTTLDCDGNQLASLDVSGCTALTELTCQRNGLTSLDVSQNTALTTLDCYNNQLTSLNLSGRTALTTLLCVNNQLTSLNLSGCTALTKLTCYNNQLASLDVSGCTALTTLDCGANQLTSLDVSDCTSLTTLDCYNNQLASLDVSGCTALTELTCSVNQLASLDVSNHIALTTLDCSTNLLRKIDLSGCTSIILLTCHMNQIKASEMANLVNSLPDLQGKGEGLFKVFYDGSGEGNEGNVCLATHVATAKAKSWKTQFTRDYDGSTWYDYKGTDNPVFTVTSSSTSGGAISFTGADNLNAVPYGTELTVVATPAEGYKLTTLTANGQDILQTKRFKVTANTRVEATFTLQAYNVTTIKLGEGTLYVTGADDLDAVTPGTELTVTAIPAEGYELTELTANDKNILDTKKVVVNEDLIIKAIFSQKTFKVSLTKHGNGTIRAIGADDLDAVPYGTELTIEATPATGSTLTALVAGGINIIETKKVTIKKETTIEAVFTTQSFAVTLTKEGEGTISATGAEDLDAVDYGTELTIVATPAAGYELVSLEANGVDITATKKVVVTDNMTVKATFSNKTFAVTLTKEGEGTITATGASNLNAVAYGTALTITATPAEGYELTALTANGEDILSTKKVVVTDNMTVKATFSNKTFAVTLTQEGEGTISATGASNLNAVAYGTALTINATPAEGYELTALTANGEDILATKKVVVTDNLTVKATFTQKVRYFAVSFTQIGEGRVTATGADDLSAVPYGTELTVVATPAAGYELTALTANGEDILSTQRFVVKDNTEVKATFTQKARNYTVTFSKTGEGRVTATGASNLDAVAYGTELTVVATPAAGYELTALTANGRDILSTKRFVVKGDTEVKATFTQKVKSFAIMFTQIGEGYLNATGADDLDAVPYGTELTIEATPATGYELTALTANGRDILSTKRFVVKGDTEVKATFTEKASNYTVTFSKTGEGRVTATGADDLDAVPYGTELTVVATPAAGYELTALTANDKDILATKKVVVTENTTIKAIFAKETFVVTLDKEGEGVLDATGADNLKAVPYGTKLTITATPAEGYELTALLANGFDIRSTKSVEVTGDTRIKAIFTQQTFAVRLTSNEHGKVKIVEPVDLQAVPYGTTLTISTTPETGYELTALTANGEDILATKSFVVKGATEIRATFSMAHFAVTLTQDGEGKVDATGAKDLTAVPYGTELTIVATPKQGYELTALTANDKDILATRKVVVTENLTVKATFAQKTFAVTLTQEGEGKIEATGADDLNAVPYGTKLTITATPAEGYELTGLLANGFDILSTKSVEVTGDTKIKAIFRKKTFAVALSSNEHGTISIVEPVDLDVVAYGTTLTVKATGKNAQCELTALTANGEDILATQSFVVKGATEVKATFVDHTGVETTVTQQTQLYPNPATDYVIVEGVAPASEVTLHSMTGERLYADRADSRGTLRIDLTPYADGVYLVSVAGETYRVVVRH